MNRSGQVVRAKLALRKLSVMRRWQAVQTGLCSEGFLAPVSRRFGQHVLQAFELSRARFLKAIQSLCWIILQFGTDRVGDASRLKARFHSGNNLICGLSTNDAAPKNEHATDEPSPHHRRSLCFLGYDRSSHSWAARKRSRPGAPFPRFTSFHVGENPGDRSLSTRPNSSSTKRATRR